MPLLTFTKQGIYCEQADLYIDPWRKVKSALITHAHSDHARPGCSKYMSTHLTKPILKHRLGKKYTIDSVEYGETRSINGVKISFHPAGHVIGSAQIRLEYKGEIWVVSGDYKVVDDGISTPFEPIKCHHYITESTFALPIYNWSAQSTIMNEINRWWQMNKELGMISLISAYSLGKAQRVMHNLDRSIGQVYVSHTIDSINQVLLSSGVKLPELPVFREEIAHEISPGSLIIGPSAAPGGVWKKEVTGFSCASASGWMAARNIRKRRLVDRGFVLSDHADWKGLLWSIRESGAENIYVTHGYTDAFTRYLRERGWNAHVVSTEYTGDGSGD